MEINPGKVFGKLKHLTSSDDYTLGILIDLVRKARQIKELRDTHEGRASLEDILKGYSAGLFFQEPSTRTNESFFVASGGLGMSVYNAVAHKENPLNVLVYTQKRLVKGGCNVLGYTNGFGDWNTLFVRASNVNYRLAC